MPDRGTIHVSRPLSNVATATKFPDLIWDKVMKPVPVDKETGKYYEFGEEFLRYYGKKRADKTPGNRVDSYSSSTSTYDCEQRSYFDIVSEREINLADDIIKPKTRVTRNLQRIVALQQEVEVAAQVFNASNYTGMTVTPTNKWNANSSLGDPQGDVETGKTAILKEVGVMPNIMVVGKEVDDQLKIHPDITEMFKYTQKGVMTPELLAQFFGVDKYIVGKSVYTTSKQGQSTDTKSFIWGKNCALLYVPDMAAIEEPAWGYTFLHKLFGGLTTRVSDYDASYDYGNGSRKIEADTSYDIKITGKKGGYYINAAVT